MRILFVSNLFPPCGRGGYEQWCEEVALALAARGHTMAVLTSNAGVTRGQRGPAAEGGSSTYPFAVHRLLHSQVEGGLAHTTLRLLREPRRFEAENLAHTQRVIDEFRPDAVMIWGMWNIDRSVPQRIEAQMGTRVAYYFCDYWPTLPSAYVQRFQEPARHAPMQHVKSLLGRYFLPRLGEADPLPLRLENPICVSRAVRDILVARGAAVEHARIVYGGTSVEQFDVARPPDTAGPSARGSEPLRLLYIGRLEPIKGVHTVVAAMQRLDSSVSLSILGAGDPDYTAALQATVAQAGMGDRVHFLGAAQRAEVPQVLAQHDVLLFPSEWDEPFARSVLEAMAAGLAVVGTTTGGTGEILVEGETGLTFAAGDAGQLGRADSTTRRRSWAAAAFSPVGSPDRSPILYTGAYGGRVGGGTPTRRKHACPNISVGERSLTMQPDTQRITITGGAGFIGSNLAHRLLAQGHQLTIFDNMSRSGGAQNIAWLQREFGADAFRLIKGELVDFAAVQHACEGAQRIYHLAGQVAVTTSVTNPRADFESNALGTFNVLEAARTVADNPIILYTSTNKVYGGMEDVKVVEGDTRYCYADYPYGIPETQTLDFHSPYGCSKGAGDQYVRDYHRIYGLRTVVARQSCIYGYRQFGIEDQGWVAWFIIAAIKGRPIRIYGNGKQVRDVLFIEDLLDAYEALVKRIDVSAGQIYNVGGGPDNTMSIWTEFGPRLEQLLGRPIPVAHGDWRPGDQPVYISDIRKVEREIGWRPRVSVEEGTRRLFEWIRDNEDLFAHL